MLAGPADKTLGDTKGLSTVWVQTSFVRSVLSVRINEIES